ncbi:hypothetical protein PCASD_18380 [Puccinia coronata f. sp. avenae]|uniref:Uncharacterized protein n=1 Tax=Puccinia coronata f. sp. avenae TaxID=200324 RepID=A0A2N5T7Y2_9BASI|nr:hypothetical protein PCASD_18380 [Puccinia coronata f. sp. avenae]
MRIEQAQVSAPKSTSRTAPAAPRNLVPNMHQVSSQQSTVSSVSSVSSVQSSSVQSSVSAPPGKSSGLTAAYEASSMKKLLFMQSQLKLDSKQYALEVQDWLEAKEDRKAKQERAAKREALKQERAYRAADRQEQKEERAQERAERQAIHDFQEEERQVRIKVASKWLKQGHSASKIQLMLQSTFGS